MSTAVSIEPRIRDVKITDDEIIVRLADVR